MTQLMEKKSSSSVKENMEAYFNTHDVSYVAEDGIFINMATGDRSQGREAVGELLHYFYNVAFDAKAEIKNLIITEDKALMEANFKGTHIGEFAGISPTHKDVNVPLCVTYEIENGLITEARIYLLLNILMEQLTSK